MTVTLPETLQYGKVVGRFILAVADVSDDPDPLPNAKFASGMITLIAKNLAQKFAEEPPTTVLKSIIPCTLDANGQLRDPAGNLGAWIAVGAYRVSYDLNEGAIAGHDILVLPEHDDENPLDLTVANPPPGPFLTPSQYAVLSARIDAKLPEIVWDGDILTVDGEASPNLTGPTGPKPSVVWEEDVLVVDGEASPPLTGPTGPKPPVAWVEDVLVVDGEASPPLTGPVSTVPGPPNVLSEGTVETLPPGSSADFSITGESPNQTLNLSLPRGDVGATGRGVVSIELDPEDNTKAIITYSDTTTETVALPVGPKGEDSVVPGPPNVLTPGTVTTVSPSTPASIEITGTSPEQVLNMSIPKGDVGSMGAAGYMPGTTDLNAISEAGVWYVQNGSKALGAPIDAFYGYLHSIYRGTSFRSQVAYSQHNGYQRAWYRSWSTNITAWHPWIEFHFPGAVGGGDLTGVGSPLGVISAPVGTYYTDTAGTNGAWRWLKKSGTGNTGWQVIHGDTGPRSLKALMPAQISFSSPSHDFQIRRIGQTVSLTATFRCSQTYPSALNGLELLRLPEGWRPTTPLYLPAGGALITAEARFYVETGVGDSSSSGILKLATNADASTTIAPSLTWLTAQPWPTTLPGTPA